MLLLVCICEHKEALEAMFFILPSTCTSAPGEKGKMACILQGSYATRTQAKNTKLLVEILLFL